MAQKTLLKGRVLSFTGTPFEGEPTEAVKISEAVLIENGRISSVSDADSLNNAHPEAKVVDHGQHVILAGFVDAHVHYPQTAMIASWGKRLIDWLNT